jgi:hypothetical protein
MADQNEQLRFVCEKLNIACVTPTWRVGRLVSTCETCGATSQLPDARITTRRASRCTIALVEVVDSLAGQTQPAPLLRLLPSGSSCADGTEFTRRFL